METKYINFAVLIIIAILSAVSSTTIDVTKRPHTNNYLSCEKCFGQLNDPTVDPRCQYGCDKNMTYPPIMPTVRGQTDMTPLPITATTTTELAPHGFIDIDPLEFAWEEGNDAKSNTREFKPSPMMKLIPRVSENIVPLITKQQKEDYDRIIEIIKLMKERENAGTFIGNNMNSMLLIVGMSAITLIIVIIILLVLVYIAFNEKSSRTTFKASGLSLPRLKIEEV